MDPPADGALLLPATKFIAPTPRLVVGCATITKFPERPLSDAPLATTTEPPLPFPLVPTAMLTAPDVSEPPVATTTRPDVKPVLPTVPELKMILPEEPLLLTVAVRSTMSPLVLD